MKDTAVKYKKPLIAIVLLGLLLLGYFTRDKWMSIFTKDSETSPGTGTNTTTTNAAIVANTYDVTIDKNTVLKRGDNNESVKELQRLMNQDLQKNHTPTLKEYLVVDGAFGALTEARLEFLVQQKSISINQFVSKHDNLT